MQPRLRISSLVSIPYSELQFRFTRSSGPGGQNVNKVATRVELVFDVLHSPTLSEAQKQLLKSRLKSRVTADGCLQLSVQESRSQWRNRELVVKRFTELVSRALREEPRRIATKPSTSGKEKRLGRKKHRARKKEIRRRVDLD